MWLRSQWQGLGLEQIEEPNDSSGRGASSDSPETTLQEGMVLGLQPMAGSKDGKYGIHVGDTVVVTSDGARRLGKTKMELFVI